MNCLNCDTELSGTWTKKFCSQSCSAKFNNKARLKNHCLACKTPIQTAAKYCSKACVKSHKDELREAKIIAGEARAPQVKSYLIALHGHRCLDPNCAWDFDKRPINVELEHKDGNASNNKLENCTLLCPNCHSQTSTYKSKNTGNGRKYRMDQYYANKLGAS